MARNAALLAAPYAYRLTAERCDVPYPTAAQPGVLRLAAADIERAPLAGGDPTRGYETLVVMEAESAGTRYGRIYVWDRAQQKMVCAGGFMGGEDPLEHAALFMLVPTATTFPTALEPLAPRRGKRVLQIAAGEHHTCVLLEGGGVRCFGQNDAGQCGGPLRPLVTVPVAVPGLADAVEVTAASNHTCARRRSGMITCWGSNVAGELGPGIDRVGVSVTQPLGAITQIAAGGSHTCALRRDGSVVCWGDRFLMARDPAEAAQALRASRPHLIAELPPAVQLCASTLGTCARLRAGGIRCWGSADPPRALQGSDGAVDMTCAQAASEVCWVDANQAPACADGRGPVELPPLRGVRSVQFSWDHACALHTDGSVACWGKNEWGQLGDGVQVPELAPRPVRPLIGAPKLVKLLAGVQALALGAQRNAVILADDALATWGYGPIGDGRDCSGQPCDGLLPTEIRFDP